MFQSRRAADYRNRRIHGDHGACLQLAGRHCVRIYRSENQIQLAWILNSSIPMTDESLLADELIEGTSLWRDARRRLFRNKLAVFGMVAVMVIVLASIAGPA